MEKITIMLATYNHDELLKKELDSFTRLYLPDIELKILVGDNAYREKTKELCQKYHAHLDITYIPQKLPGKNNTLNALLPHAEGELYVFTDDDIIADEKWIFFLSECAKKYPETTLFGGRILPLFPEGMKMPDNSMVNRYVNAGNWNQEEGTTSHLRIFGANMMVRSEIFTEGVQFDPNIGPNGKNYMMGSETEFNLRLALHGYQAAYVPDAIVHHHIKSEQCSVKWWLSRMERRGRGSLLIKEPSETKKFLGAPRFIYLKAVKYFLGSKIAQIMRKKDEAISHKAEYYFAMGQIKQYREFDAKSRKR